ncbi:MULTISPECIES: O-acetyl-ADP-ribose deacetylase [unclassified Arthrobacter]|uniref:O-acetyl-ADP-ribose deacetylase n=1 Tax=unclassified Arthrobacter TaxID=235627 RepID=UPI0021073030|nr:MULTISPECIES: O-acetyl-ADP-ribose deacetylase [unclassified Arthrobacter]MCQ1947737.1 O-acetyl-ADP-ribose deacetylase [Arthrobacter sp. zg-Y1116]MCQ1987680.1 O-acetyl-ADP-ribose deacetylase [Arthrobacter sp. zg-Y844]MCQ1996359.1 O-acetyl-ADP-ribose deacetylase [Arthrobacter sp. zg-Y1171]UWX82600.1 O-acetyl-ADP-ribose deacetylase [Arthrobacter sp. zg-Y1171]
MQITIATGDITTRDTDVVVNAANSSLLGGGGVDGAIHRAAGPQLLAACRELRKTSLPQGLPTGRSVATEAFNLPARWVVHTVGPNAGAGETDPELLRSCFRTALAAAEDLGAESISFPAVSAGIYGWDPETVAGIGLQELLDHTPGTLKRAEFVLFNDRLAGIFARKYEQLAG